ncbi:MAG TPA: MFS transporter, partial [Chitinophagaceae bacterium]|nr:MFS transporter [Chitinophagaceae bacterium]
MKISEANKLRLLYFLVFCCTAAWLPIFADYCKAQGFSGVKTGVILSIPPLMMFLVQPFYGMAADRFGYKKTLLFSSLFAAISFALYLFNGGFAFLFLVTVLMALFYNTLQPVLDSLSLKLVKLNPAFSYGTLRIAGAAGWAFTGIINGYLIDAIDTSVIFTVAAVSMLLTFIFGFSLADDKEKEKVASTQSFENVKDVFTNRVLLFLLFCVFLVSAGATTIWNFYSIYMKENGASASLVGYGISFQGLCELPLFYFSAVIIRKLGLKTTLVVTIFATALRMLLYSLVKNPQAAIAIELLHGISWSLFWVVCVEYVNLLIRQDWRATGQSLLYAAYFGAGAIAGNFWTGYLSDAHMKISSIFFLNAAIVAVVAILVWIFLTKKTGEREGYTELGIG